MIQERNNIMYVREAIRFAGEKTVWSIQVLRGGNEVAI
jgi:hypothetical protein